MHLYDAATNRLSGQLRRRPAAATGRRSSAAAFSPDSTQLAVILTGRSPPSRCACLTRPPCSPTTEARPSRRQAGVGGRRRSSAPTAATSPPRCRRFTGRSSERLGYPGLRPGLGPPLARPAHPIRVPTGTDVQGMALSPDGQHLVHGLAPDCVRRRIGHDGSGGERTSTSYTALDINARGRCSPRGPGRSEGRALLVDAANGETVRTLRGHRDLVRRHPVLARRHARGVGLHRRRAHRLGHRHRSALERWDTFDPWGVGFGPDNDLVYGGGGDSMLRTWDLSGQDTYLRQTTQVGEQTRCSRARRFLPGRAAGGLSLARRQGPRVGQVRRHADRRGDVADPPSGDGGRLRLRLRGIPTADSTPRRCTAECAEPGNVSGPRHCHG